MMWGYGVMEDKMSYWAGEHGVKWTDKFMHKDFSRRMFPFAGMMGGLDIESILEVGANIGYNLKLLTELKDYRVAGCDISEYAVKNAIVSNVILGDIRNLPYKDESFDLVFTAGVLMHSPPEDMGKCISELVRVAKKYILLIEYYGEPYYQFECNKICLDALPSMYADMTIWVREYANYVKLPVIARGFWGRLYGFDETSWWVFSKRLDIIGEKRGLTIGI